MKLPERVNRRDLPGGLGVDGNGNLSDGLQGGQSERVLKEMIGNGQGGGFSRVRQKLEGRETPGNL